MANVKRAVSASVERISHSILIVRGLRVIVDAEPAKIYGVETRALNQAVKPNAARFPEDFRFQLTAEEAAASTSQSVTFEAEPRTESQVSAVRIYRAWRHHGRRRPQ